MMLVFITRNHSFFLLKELVTPPPFGLFAPLSSLTKMPFWTNYFGAIHFDWWFFCQCFDYSQYVVNFK